MDMINGRKVIVTLSKLIDLASATCCNDDVRCKVRSVTPRLMGSCVHLSIMCTNGHIRHWSSSDIVTSDQSFRGIYANNLLSGAAVLLSGNNFRKISTFCTMFGLQFISEKTFYRYLKTYYTNTNIIDNRLLFF